MAACFFDPMRLGVLSIIAYFQTMALALVSAFRCLYNLNYPGEYLSNSKKPSPMNITRKSQTMDGALPAEAINPAKRWVRRSNRWAYRFSRHWMLGFTAVFGLYIWLPFLAPALMSLGYEVPARAIYTLYSFLCHQLPQRSYFLFGQQFTYSLADIQGAWQNTTNFNLLRQFLGTPEMGWKVAWSDRMVSMYTSILLIGWLWYPWRKRIRPLRLSGFLMLLFPMALDGFSHMVSDFAGIGQGFRDSNAWLAALTGGAMPAAFYAGDAWGSFNSIMRLATGILFGLGVVWFGFPLLDEYFQDYKERIRQKFQRSGLSL